MSAKTFRVFLDTNFLLDAMTPGRPQAEESAEVFRAVLEGRVEAFCMVNQLVDFYYIARKTGISEPARREAVGVIAECCSLFQPGLETVAAALSSDEPDFEDGLVRAAAEQCRADCIATRDAKAFLGSRVCKMEPRDLAEKVRRS